MVFLEILILISAISVTLAPSLIRSTLFLMLTFLLCGLFLSILGSELLSLLFLLVYIGAISVLFLFVIMLLQVSKNEIINYNIMGEKDNTIFELLISVIGFIFIILFVYFIFLTLCYSFPIAYDSSTMLEYVDFAEMLYETSNVYALGSALFINYWLSFLVITLIIILTSFGVIIILR